MKQQRLSTYHPNEVLRAMTANQKIQHYRDSICNALMNVGGRGQPPMGERLRAAVEIVDQLESNGVPFRFGRNSRMNRELLSRLHEEARRATDTRNSRCKPITPDAVRDLLRQIDWLRFSGNHFTKMFPYTE
jgi:hypothetical protein